MTVLQHPSLLAVAVGLTAAIVGVQWVPDGEPSGGLFFGLAVVPGFRSRPEAGIALRWYRFAIVVGALTLLGTALLPVSGPPWLWRTAAALFAQVPVSALARELGRGVVLPYVAPRSSEAELLPRSIAAVPGGPVWVGSFLMLTAATVLCVHGWPELGVVPGSLRHYVFLLTASWLGALSAVLQAVLLLRSRVAPGGDRPEGALDLRYRQAEQAMGSSWLCSILSLGWVLARPPASAFAIALLPWFGLFLLRSQRLRALKGDRRVVCFDPSDTSVFVPNPSGGHYLLNLGRPLGLALFLVPLVVPVVAWIAVVALG